MKMSYYKSMFSLCLLLLVVVGVVVIVVGSGVGFAVGDFVIVVMVVKRIDLK